MLKSIYINFHKQIQYYTVLPEVKPGESSTSSSRSSRRILGNVALPVVAKIRVLIKTIFKISQKLKILPEIL